jgi:hypothetical protein
MPAPERVRIRRNCDKGEIGGTEGLKRVWDVLKTQESVADVQMSLGEGFEVGPVLSYPVRGIDRGIGRSAVMWVSGRWAGEEEEGGGSERIGWRLWCQLNECSCGCERSKEWSER